MDGGPPGVGPASISKSSRSPSVRSTSSGSAVAGLPLTFALVAVIGTLLVQAWIQPLLDKLPRRQRAQRNDQIQRLEPEQRAALTRLASAAGLKSPADLLHDSEVFERAMDRYVASAPLAEDLAVFTRLRRALGPRDDDAPPASDRGLAKP